MVERAHSKKMSLVFNGLVLESFVAEVTQPEARVAEKDHQLLKSKTIPKNNVFNYLALNLVVANNLTVYNFLTALYY